MTDIRDDATVKKVVEEITHVSRDLETESQHVVTLVFDGLDRADFLRLVRAKANDHSIDVTIRFRQPDMSIEVNGHQATEL